MDLEIEYFNLLKKFKEDLDKNLEKYFENIKNIANKYNLEIYLVGSRVRGDYLEGSDYDIVVFIPDDTYKDWLKILRELKESVNENPYFEFHIYKKSWKEILDIYYKDYKKL
ncbi:hypothetical protein YN1_3140 [Nanoarchaeota archaeon]